MQEIQNYLKMVGFELGPLRGPLEDPRFKIIGALEKLENYLKYWKITIC